MGWRTILAGWVGSRKRFLHKGKSGALLAYLFRQPFRLAAQRISETLIKVLILLLKINNGDPTGNRTRLLLFALLR
jgi:hypothetical protein